MYKRPYNEKKDYTVWCLSKVIPRVPIFVSLQLLSTIWKQQTFDTIISHVSLN